MALPTSDTDRPLLQLAETLLKQAMTEGLDLGQAEKLMEPSNYSPTDPAGYENKVRDTNRIIAAGLFVALRSLPVRLPTYTVTTVPPAGLWRGSLIFVSNGAAGGPVVAFSSGTQWLRCDTNTAIS